MPPAHSAPDPAAVERLLEWSVGGDSRLVRTGRAEAALVLHGVKRHSPDQRDPRNQPGPASNASTPLTRCMPITDALPSLPGRGVVFLLIAGKLHLLDVRAPARTKPPVPLDTSPPDLTFARLLYLDKKSISSRTRLHALVRRGSGPDELWSFTIESGRAAGIPARHVAAFENVEAFFGHFYTPRCKADGTDCLVVARDSQGTVIDVEERPGQARRELAVIGERDVLVAAWNPNAGNSVYRLTACPEPQATP